jgi:hypothetical protein
MAKASRGVAPPPKYTPGDEVERDGDFDQNAPDGSTTQGTATPQWALNLTA